MLFFSVFLVSVSLFWIIKGFSEYGFMTDAGLPTVGFFPICIGFIVLIMSILCFVRYAVTRSKEKGESDKNSSEEEAPRIIAFIPEKFVPYFTLVCGIVIALVFYYVGTLTAIVLSCFAWKYFISHSSVVKSLIFAFVLALIVYLVFVVWLNTPFPKGLLI